MRILRVGNNRSVGRRLPVVNTVKLHKRFICHAFCFGNGHVKYGCGIIAAELHHIDWRSSAPVGMLKPVVKRYTADFLFIAEKILPYVIRLRLNSIPIRFKFDNIRKIFRVCSYMHRKLCLVFRFCDILNGRSVISSVAV